jgi:phosphatidylglycerophosphate synthase
LLTSALPLVALGFASFVALFWQARGNFRQGSGLGAANGVTLLRLALVLGLGGAFGALPLRQCALLAALVLLLDGVDGWVARRTQGSSPFGAHFDMESDAFFVLVCVFVLWTRERLGAWVLWGGLLRPLSVIWLWALPAANAAEPRSEFGRIAFLGFALGLIAPLASASVWADALASAGTGLVTLSFARSARHWHRARVQARSGKEPLDSGKIPGT